MTGAIAAELCGLRVAGVRILVGVGGLFVLIRDVGVDFVPERGSVV